MFSAAIPGILPRTLGCETEGAGVVAGGTEMPSAPLAVALGI